ncbi:hypothetical protein [Pseudoduganella violaceinigra]|uniref:hypothetical protein n=1 Tax=Pseudoduganella violaceinigra TaxID=246602 RepID=UPI00047F843B|nr:hypothetical protein [Pseudoduganella violaceinigra]
MITPCVSITRHKAGLYEWTVTLGQESFDGDVGDSSISSCLTSAANGLPDEIRLVEVVYRAVHMGTFERLALEHAAEDIADKIATEYFALTSSN